MSMIAFRLLWFATILVASVVGWNLGRRSA